MVMSIWAVSLEGFVIAYTVGKCICGEYYGYCTGTFYSLEAAKSGTMSRYDSLETPELVRAELNTTAREQDVTGTSEFAG
jgi:hypothetical protein